MYDELNIARKEKRWMILTKAYVTYGGQTVYPDASHPLSVKVVPAQGEDPAVYAGLVDSEGEPLYDAWVVNTIVGSFITAKEIVIDLATVLGISYIKLVRVVDLTTELLPIS